MPSLSDHLKKAPQPVKDKYNIQIRRKVIERVKEKIINTNKTIDDYSDDQIEAMNVEGLKVLKEQISRVLKNGN